MKTKIMKCKLQTTILLFFLALNCVWAQYPAPTHEMVPHTNVPDISETVQIGEAYMTNYWPYLKKLKLHEVSMLGSHHATYDDAPGYCSPQDDNLEDQIDGGVRYADIRINADYDEDQGSRPHPNPSLEFFADHGTMCPSEHEDFRAEMQRLNIRNQIGSKDIIIMHIKQFTQGSQVTTSLAQSFALFNTDIGYFFGADIITPSEVPNFNTTTLEELQSHGRFIFVSPNYGGSNVYHAPKTSALGHSNMSPILSFPSGHTTDLAQARTDIGNILSDIQGSSTYNNCIRALGFAKKTTITNLDLSSEGDFWNGKVSDNASNSIKTFSESGYSYVLSVDGVENHNNNSRKIAAQMLESNLTKTFVPSISHDGSSKITFDIPNRMRFGGSYEYELWKSSGGGSWSKHSDITVSSTASSHTINGISDDGSFYYLVNKKSQLRSDIMVTVHILEGHWRFEEMFGNTAADDSGKGRTGTWQGSVFSVTDYMEGYFGVSMGNGGWIDIPDFNLTGNFTVAAWVGSSGLDNTRAIIGAAGGNDINFYQDKARLYNGGSDVVIASSTMTQAKNSYGFTHIAITRKAGTVKLYVNGTLESTGTWNGTFNVGAIGKGNLGAGSHEFILDDLRIYSTALSQSQIQALPAVPGGASNGAKNANTKLLSVEDDDTIIKSIELYPNPATDAFSFTVPTEFKQSKVNVNISDISGKVQGKIIL